MPKERAVPAVGPDRVNQVELVLRAFSSDHSQAAPADGPLERIAGREGRLEATLQIGHESCTWLEDASIIGRRLPDG